MKVDIIGGSISGMSSAISLKKNKKSISVTVHEKHKKIGYNRDGRRCGEAHSIEKDWSKWIPEDKSYFNQILHGLAVIADKEYSYDRKPLTAFLLNRQEFICQLSREAEKLGVKIQTNDKINSISKLDGDYIIDASGFPSSIKKNLGIKQKMSGLSYQETIEDSNVFISDTIKIIFSGNCGYYWIFPRNPEKKEINIGIGIFGKYNSKLKEELQKFKEKNNIKGKVNHVTGGLIPLGLQKPLKYKNILFVGDSGVGTFTITGQGIYRALLSGDIAGECIAKGSTNKYPYIINQKFIKWDIVGKNLLRMNNVFREINPKLVLMTYNYFTDFVKSFH